MSDLKEQRIYWLDTVRVLAMLMVVFMHAPIPGRNLESSLFLGALSYLTYPCIGLFFMASGALLLPVKIDYKEFLRRRFTRILFPTICWSIFYITVKYFYGEIDLQGVMRLLIQMPFGAVEGVLWFMYTLAGLYLFAPFISKWLQDAPKREIEYFLLFWLIVMSIPYLKAFVPVRESDYHLLSTFSGFLGYMVIGFYLKKFPVNLRKTVNKLRLGILLVIFSILLPAFFYLKPVNGLDPGTLMYNYLSISVVVMSVFWFVIIQNSDRIHQKNWYTSIIKDISILSFGIYLVHIFIMRRLIWNIIPVGSFNLVIEVFIVALATFLVSYLLIKIIHHFSLGKYIVG